VFFTSGRGDKRTDAAMQQLRTQIEKFVGLASSLDVLIRV
jgi:hypothetical protein